MIETSGELITPERFNLAEAICKRHADAVTRIALIDGKPAASNTYTYGGLDFISDKFASALSLSGVAQGDAVAVILPQSAALVTAHLGALKLGAVVVPLSPSLDEAKIEYQLRDSKAKAVVADFSIRANIAEITSKIPSVEQLFIAGDSREANEASFDGKSFWREVYEASSDFNAVETLSTAPAFIFYTIAPDGEPRGVVRSHGSLPSEFAEFERTNKLATDDESVFGWQQIRLRMMHYWASCIRLYGMDARSLSLVHEGYPRINLCCPSRRDITGEQRNDCHWKHDRCFKLC